MLKSSIIFRPRIWNCDWQHFLNELDIKNFLFNTDKKRKKKNNPSLFWLKRSVWKVRASHLEACGGRLKAVRMAQEILFNPQDSGACLFVKPALL